MAMSRTEWKCAASRVGKHLALLQTHGMKCLLNTYFLEKLSPARVKGVGVKSTGRGLLIYQNELFCLAPNLHTSLSKTKAPQLTRFIICTNLFDRDLGAYILY